MLAESILINVAYQEEWRNKSHQSQALREVGEDPWQKQFKDTDANGDFCTEFKKQSAEKVALMCCDKERGQEVPQQNSLQKPPAKGCNNIPQSTPQCIPRQEQHCENELDLYRSWSCESLYQNYPDLHIGGDHIADHTCDSGCIMDQTYDGSSAGPVLFSNDIPLGHSPLTEPVLKFKSVKFWHGEDIGEKSMTFHKQPLSNSLLNNYMEAKVQELYKQFLEEKLTRCSSLTHFLTSNMLVNNISEVNLQLPHEKHGEASKATQTLFQSLARLGLQNTGSGNSSEFSTPNLQISTPHCRRKPSVV
ncbi:TLR adapter interacting with SLC15A4 on the lysosome-like [Zootoca vivipara]|uniref:TLR adapter interacting with SLC15A4 on the lysosome-like n=1 Tax=Zootoca vivipara TaxID=8524 RepID=UPI0015913F18|nr:TLR adapter interacting with SLC15A4 on the lysosome-like [Zootoca vivipara]